MKDTFNNKTGNYPVRVALNGMRGIGKSQLALKYAVTSYDEERYLFIFWISATTVDKIRQGLVHILHHVQHPERSNPDEAVRLLAARSWLEGSPKKWLLVLDNVMAETIELLREHLPRLNSNGNILFTTWARDVAESLVHTAGRKYLNLAIGPLNVEEAASLLIREAGCYEEVAATEDEVIAAQGLVKQVGCLPLAVHQAASILESGRSIEELDKVYDSEKKIEASNTLHLHESINLTIDTSSR